MTLIEVEPTLTEAWEERKKLWAAGSKKIENGNALWKEISALPGAARVTVWYSFSEMSCDAARMVYEGYTLRQEGDCIWHEAVIKAKGVKAKLTWIYDDQAKGYMCTLDSGEEFKA